MKILIVTEYFPRDPDLQFSGGVETRNFYVAKYLSMRHDVTIITKRLQDAKGEEEMFGFNVIRVGTPVPYKAVAGSAVDRISFIFNCIKRSRELDIDVVEGTNFVTHFAAYWIARNKKVKAIAWYPDVWIGSWIKNTGAVGILGEILERINLKLGFKYYIAISNETKRKLQKHTQNSITVIPCGVDPQEYRVITKKQEGKIICISRLAKYKNISNLLKAFALVHQKLQNTNLTIIGEGPEKPNLESQLKNLKLTNAVTFLNNLKRKELIKELKESQAFCLPSAVEGFGISIIESAAAGVPYVISDIPVFKEITNDFIGGFAFKAGNIHELAEKINLLLINEKTYDKKAQECKNLAAQYRWSKIAQETEKVYIAAANRS